MSLWNKIRTHFFWKRKGKGIEKQWEAFFLLKRYLPLIDKVERFNVTTPLKENVPQDTCFFVYWKQGVKNAPEIVQICIDNLKRRAGDHPIVILTEQNIWDYVDFPQRIKDLYFSGDIRETQFSDLIRANLLTRYGGFWFDATCFLSDPIPDFVEKAPQFFFSRFLLQENLGPLECSSWFIKANHGNRLLAQAQQFMFVYYQHQSKPCHYFIFHMALSLLIKTDSQCAAEWSLMPYVCNMNPHVFMYSFYKPYSEQGYQFILKSCFVHKLTYKFKPPRSEREGVIEGNVLQHFLASKGI